jgi:hypothetical protein
MNIADHYLARAAEFHAKAQSERNPGRRSQLEALERDHLRLTAQAEHTPTDIRGSAFEFNEQIPGTWFKFQDGRPE